MSANLLDVLAEDCWHCKGLGVVRSASWGGDDHESCEYCEPFRKLSEALESLRKWWDVVDADGVVKWPDASTVLIAEHDGKEVRVTRGDMRAIFQQPTAGDES